MISQADIIRTLVNMNCTDESVMSMALSTNCTPRKLLDKLTEAERFDLALDVSMKLGLDVIPLWKTWAIRCLRNRNFQRAREKFRHCFLRLRLPGNRTNPGQSRLLNDILSELTKMDEIQLTLSEEIEIIKHRKYSNLLLDEQSVKSKPKIYEECKYYLREYGKTEDLVKFYIKNNLWEDAIKVLLEKSREISLDKFFLPNVILYTASTGHLNDIIAAFLKFDPELVLSSLYFEAMYNFYTRNGRYNLLYYTQVTIGDYIAAADVQINNFFLRKPVLSYRELNHRLTHLNAASTNYHSYLSKPKSILDIEEESPNLLRLITLEEAKKQLSSINCQIEITRNFALNEVSGCMNGVDYGFDDIEADVTDTVDDSPVTLFDTSERRKTFLTALVLMYYDPLCGTYFSQNGLDLANKLIDSCGLDKLRVFKTAMRIIVEDESCDILENATLLLERIKEDYLSTSSNKPDDKVKDEISKQELIESNLQPASRIKTSNRDDGSSCGVSSNDSDMTASDKVRSICDEVIRDSIGSCREADYKMELMKLLSVDAKIELYIEHGKLSNAQRLACNMNRPDYVSSIIEEATRLNQNHVKTVCQLWLAKHETRNFIR